eukprot:1185527-Prorocentrum_minimum.AAC.1
MNHAHQRAIILNYIMGRHDYSLPAGYQRRFYTNTILAVVDLLKVDFKGSSVYFRAARRRMGRMRRRRRGGGGETVTGVDRRAGAVSHA